MGEARWWMSARLEGCASLVMANPFDHRARQRYPGTEGSKCLFLADGLGFRRNVRRHPIRERHLVTHVATGCRVLLSDLGQLLGREAAGEPNQRWPEPAMNQRDFAIDEPANKDLLGFENCFKDGVDVMILRVRPPTALDWFADDGLGEERGGSLG